MSFVNLSDSRKTLLKNQRVGTAYEVDEMLPDELEQNDVTFRTCQGKQTESPDIPECLSVSAFMFSVR